MITTSILTIGSIMAQETIQTEPPIKPHFSIALAADPQYADKDSLGTRNYRGSKFKLREFTYTANQQNADATIFLGDMIDDNQDDLFDIMFQICTLKMPVYSVAGNHDFEAFPRDPQKIYNALMMPSPFYAEKIKKTRLLFLDGNRMSFYAWPKGSPEFKQSKNYKEKFAESSADWNGGLGLKQLNWLKKQLEEAQAAQERVILFCHFPIYPKDPHNLWDSEATMTLIRQYSCVKAWISGHNHKGNYAQLDNIHFLTIEGMVEGEDNSYAILHFFSDRIELEGFGREKSRTLKIR